MMGPRQEAQAALFYEFSLEDHVPQDHLLRSIDRFVDLASIRAHLADFYSHTGRPSVDPELLIRMLLVGYCFGIRSERRLCEEVHLNLAYRWFCRLDLTDRIPDHSTFSKNRHGRFRESDLLRHVFESTVALPARDIGEVTDPKLVWHVGCELPVDLVIRTRLRGVGVGSDWLLPPHNTLYSHGFHQPFHCAAGNVMAVAS